MVTQDTLRAKLPGNPVEHFTNKLAGSRVRKTVTYDTLRKSNLSRKPWNTLRTMRTEQDVRLDVFSLDGFSVHFARGNATKPHETLYKQ